MSPRRTRRPSQGNGLSQYSLANARTQAGLGDDIDRHVQQILQIEEQATEIEKGAPGFQLNEEIDVARVIAVPSRDGSEDAHIAGAATRGRSQYVVTPLIAQFLKSHDTALSQ